MKLILAVFALSAAVSAAAVEEYKCGGDCTLEYAPIRCSNGSKTVYYNNFCEYTVCLLLIESWLVLFFWLIWYDYRGLRYDIRWWCRLTIRSNSTNRHVEGKFVKGAVMNGWLT